jgi:outer membrane protein TolC
MVRTWFEEGYQGLLALINHLGLIALVLVLAPTLVWSQAESSSDLAVTDAMAGSAPRLETYLAQAALESPELKAAYYEWQAALEKSGYVGSLPDPVISFGYFIENVETRVGPQQQRFSLKQSVPWFGTLGAKKQIASEAARAAFRKYQAQKLSLFYQVKAAYYDYYYLGRDLALTAENLELMTFWEAVVRTKYKVGLKQHPDVIKAQVELGKLEDRLQTLNDRVRPSAVRLREISNMPDTVMLPIPSELVSQEQSLNHDSIMSAALAGNPNLKAIEHLIDKARAGVRLAGKVSRPSFSFGVDYIKTGEALNPAMTDSGKDPWIVGVGVKLPIWFGKNRARKAEAQARLNAAEQKLDGSENRLTILVDNLLFEHADALRKMRLYRDGLVPKAEQALNASYTAYQAGQTDFLNVLDAQRQLLAFELQMEKSRANLATRLAEIEMVTGNELE